MRLFEKIFFVFARQWIAGMSVEDAIRSAKRTNERGEKAILNYLGEGYSRESEIGKSTRIYIELLHSMKSERIRGSISVKPTQLGMLVSDSTFFRNYERIVRLADSMGYFVWMDMEEYTYVERTLHAYLRMLENYMNIGICLQAKLKRSLKDAGVVGAEGGAVRIVKGAYDEPDGKGYSNKNEIRGNFLKMLNVLLKRSCSVIVATHDDYLVYKAVDAEKRYKSKVTFAMLKGIRGRLVRELADKGEDVGIYTPFGEDWIRYSIRRLKEEGHAALLLRSILQQ